MFQTSERRSHLHLLRRVTHLNDSLAAFGCRVECSFKWEHQLKFNTGEKTLFPADLHSGLTLLV